MRPSERKSQKEILDRRVSKPTTDAPKPTTTYNTASVFRFPPKPFIAVTPKTDERPPDVKALARRIWARAGYTGLFNPVRKITRQQAQEIAADHLSGKPMLWQTFAKVFQTLINLAIRYATKSVSRAVNVIHRFDDQDEEIRLDTLFEAKRKALALRHAASILVAAAGRGARAAL